MAVQVDIDWIEVGAELAPVVATRPDQRLVNYFFFATEDI